MSEVAELDRDIVDWEIAACRALVAILVGVIGMLLAIAPAIGRSLATTTILLATIAILHFLLQRRGLEVLAARPQAHGTMEVLRWIGASIEVSYASIATMMVLRVHGASWAMTSPVTMVYVFGMVSASFRLRPALAVYAAVLASVQWLAIYYLLIAPRLDAASTAALPTLRPWAAWERASWILGAGCLLAVAAARLRRLALDVRRHARLERLVSPDVASRALAGSLELGRSERSWVTVLFCDLRDFTALCEHRRAEDVLTILNAFYARACQIVEANGGRVNKFLGDGILALFDATGAPRAVACARALSRAVDDLRARGGVWEDLEVGIGLDTGDVVLGALGSADRMEYTAIGATVNRAARLQAHASIAHRRIVLSARTASELGDGDQLLPLGEAKIKGVDLPVRIYTPR